MKAASAGNAGITGFSLLPTRDFSVTTSVAFVAPFPVLLCVYSVYSA